MFAHFATRLTWLGHTLHFLQKHFVVIFSLGLVAAFGRVIQLGGFGEIASWMNLVLEVVIESARILLFLYVLGLTSIKNGVLRIRTVFIDNDKRKRLRAVAFEKLKKQPVSILLNIFGFLTIAFVLNYLIELLAYETCLYLTLKTDGILATSSSEWTILLFFKNISVIPFTLAFDAVFLLWITNRLQIQTYDHPSTLR